MNNDFFQELDEWRKQTRMFDNQDSPKSKAVEFLEKHSVPRNKSIEKEFEEQRKSMKQFREKMKNGEDNSL